MPIKLNSVYNPKGVESKIYQFWEEKGYFHGKVNKDLPDGKAGKPSFSLVIPPPNITGILHMGHVLDNTPQDILVRFKRMQGFETTWVPGTDHAGIATQNAVEKMLHKEGINRNDLGREKFIARIWQWKEQFGNTIIQQLKRLGCSCDWERLRFTMDEDYSRAVQEVFIRLYEKGLIYQGDYIINWCPRCVTALSDEEVEHREIEGGLYWIRYPLANPKEADIDYILVATTRPETMLGDTAVAVHPDDKRYKDLIGKMVILPILNREIPIIADEFANPEFGSGAVKVTPAHDPNDFLIGQRQNLPSVIAIGPDGKMNENAGPYQGLDRFECRKRIIDDLTKQGLFDKKDKHLHAVGHCYRCETMIEPYLSRQWFIKMKPLAEPAIKAARDGRVKFFPERWLKVYLNWLENIRDWCISRQLWWGHRIPVWYCQSEAKDCPPIVSRETPTKCPKCGNTNLADGKAGLVQDPDVLDTWFSSWLWPFAVFGWPKETPDLKYFYPTTWLNSGKDIIFFWVSRMIMAGLEFKGDVPFKYVYIHGIARDARGRKLSKSLGNSPDPLDLIEKFSADALRFGIMANIPLGGDINLSNDTYVSGRNFCNKLWNASRLVLMNLPDSQEPRTTSHKSLSFEDRWILSRLHSTIQDYTKALETYEFSQATHIIYHFFWGDVCDWYLEIIKPRLYQKSEVLSPKSEVGGPPPIRASLPPNRARFALKGDAKGGKSEVSDMLLDIFSNLLRMLHPFIPHITEELWQHFRQGQDWAESVMIAPWPSVEKDSIDKSLEETMELLIDIVRGIRDIRNKMNIDKKQSLKVVISTEDSAIKDLITEHLSLINNLDRIEKIEVGLNLVKPAHSATEVISKGDKRVLVFVPLEGVINLEAEKERLGNRLKKVEERLIRVKKRLSQDEFREKAPEAVREKEQLQLDQLTEQFTKLQTALKEINDF